MTLATETVQDELLSVYLRQWLSLRTQLRKRVGSADLADDALQETWIRVSGMKDPPAVGNKQAFLLRIASNIAIDLIRRERRHHSHCIADEALLTAIADTAPSPEVIAVDRDQLRALVGALMRLPERPRSALLMNRCDGLSHREIAARLDVSESMVAKYLAQGLRHCRDAFRRLD